MNSKWNLDYRVAGVLVLTATILTTFQALTREVTIQVLSTNDLHGALDGVVTDDPSQGKALGTFERVAGQIRGLRDSWAGPTIVLDAGDCFQGVHAINHLEGGPCREFFNAVGYSALTLGNHEFDYLDVGDDSKRGAGWDRRGALKKAYSGLDSTVVLANVFFKNGDKRPIIPGLVPYKILDVDGVKVGVTGVLTTEVPAIVSESAVGDLEVRPAEVALRDVIPKMKADGAQAIIVLAHLRGACPNGDGRPAKNMAECRITDELGTLANELDPSIVSLIIAGHAHVFLAGEADRIPVSETYGQGTFIGRAVLKVDTEQRVAPSASVLPAVPVCSREIDGSSVCSLRYPGFMGASEVANDVLEIVTRARAAVFSECLQMVFVARGDILHTRVVETSLANLSADLVRMTPTLKGLPAGDIGMMNMGSTRDSILSGDVGLCDIYKVWPFKDPPVLVRLTGAEIKELLGFAIDTVGKPPAISGLEITRAGDGSLEMRTDDGALMDPKRMYRLVTTKFLIEVGDNLNQFFNKVPKDRFSVVGDGAYRDYFIELLKKMEKVEPPRIGRYSGVSRR